MVAHITNKLLCQAVNKFHNHSLTLQMFNSQINCHNSKIYCHNNHTYCHNSPIYCHSNNIYFHKVFLTFIFFCTTISLTLFVIFANVTKKKKWVSPFTGQHPNLTKSTATTTSQHNLPPLPSIPEVPLRGGSGGQLPNQLGGMISSTPGGIYATSTISSSTPLSRNYVRGVYFPTIFICLKFLKFFS